MLDTNEPIKMYLKKQTGTASIFLLMSVVVVIGACAWVGDHKYQHRKERDEIVKVVLKDYSEKL